MGDEAYIGLVHPHAESDGGDHHEPLLTQELALALRPLRSGEAGMVGECGHALLPQPFGGFVRLPTGKAVDDSGFAGVAILDEAQQAGAPGPLRRDGVTDVGAVEGSDEIPCPFQRQLLDDLAAGAFVGRGGEGDAGHVGEAFVQNAQLAVFGPEVMPPLGDAVRLVNGEKRHGRGRQQLQRAFLQQPLRGDVEQIDAARADLPLDPAHLLPVECGIEECGAHPQFGERQHLILHQGDERRDDDADAGTHECRELVAQRLAATGRHQREDVLAGDESGHDLLLQRAEGFMTEDALQQLPRPLHGRAGGRHFGGRVHSVVVLT